MKNKFLFIVLFLFGYSYANAQTFGFGCLGLSGFYGGYGINTYEATGLNSSLSAVYNSSSFNGDPVKFEQSTGFRFGANILRANFDYVFLTAKGFFQFAKESHSRNYTTGEDPTVFDFELTSNHWGVGIDFGFPVFSFLDLKLVEGGITIYNVEYKEKVTVNETEITETTYSTDDTEVGYYLGTGLILNLIEGYVSIEGTAMYHFYEIGEMTNNSNTAYPISSVDQPFIEKGGFAAALQLNIGFPL